MHRTASHKELSVPNAKSAKVESPDVVLVSYECKDPIFNIQSGMASRIKITSIKTS